MQCPNLQKSLGRCQGTPELPGMKRRLYYISKGYIVKWPTLPRDAQGRITSKALKKSAGGAILPFFLLITYGHSQLSTIGGECFFVADGVQAFRGEALVQVADFWWFY